MCKIKFKPITVSLDFDKWMEEREKNYEKNMIRGFIGFVIFCIIIGSLPKNKTIYRERFNTFNKADIKGIIEYCRYSEKVFVELKIYKDSNVYYFIPINGEESPFLSIASKGDSIIKPSYKEEIVLLKKDDDLRLKYIYNFE